MEALPNAGEPAFLESLGSLLFVGSWTLAFLLAALAGFLYRLPGERRVFAELTVIFEGGLKDFEPRGVLLLRLAFGLAALGLVGLLLALFGGSGP